MPSVDSYLLRALSRPSPSPSYRGGSEARLMDLLQQRADFEGEAAHGRADIWGNAFREIGSQIQSYRDEKKLKARDQAWMSFISEGNWQRDPKAAYARTLEIWGPDEGPKQFQGLVSATQLMQPKRDPERDQKALGAVSGAYLGMAPEARAQLYPSLRGLVLSAYPALQLPEQHDPAFDESVVMPLVRQMAPRSEGFSLSPGQRRFDAQGKEIASVPDEPKEPAGFSLSPGEVRYDGQGNVVASRPAAPRELKEPKLVQIETTDENGKAVTRFVNPEAGASYPKPTGAAKPASGQQRRALSFFNRGMEADKIAAQLEEDGNINPTALRYVPGWANVTLSTENQQYRQAQRAFTEARLRKESGATIKDEEYEADAETYFPQPGDDEQTKAQKRAMRNAVLAGMALESGDALREFYGDEAEGMLAGFRQATRPAGGPVQVRTPEDYNRLPAGAVYIDPQGRRRKKGGR